MAGRCKQRVVALLKSNEFGFQVAYSLLETTHFRQHAGIGTADMAE